MLGSVLSLGAAFFWAGGVILFKKSGENFSPVSLNIYKSCVAFILVVLTMLFFNIPFIPDKPINEWLLLAASGFIGITLSDILFFMALNRLGAGVVAIVECLYLPSVIFFSFILLGERLSIGAVIGGIMVLAAIVVGSVTKSETDGQCIPKLCISEKCNTGSISIPDTNTGNSNARSNNTGNKHSKNTDVNINIKSVNSAGNSRYLFGIAAGFLSMISVAIGIVIIKELLETTGVLWATMVRVGAAIVSLMTLILFLPKKKQYFRELKFSKAWFTAFPASVSGNFLALLCWIGGMKYTTASRAAILNQMSTIFIFILASVFLKEKITTNKSIAILLAVGGACITIFI